MVESTGYWTLDVLRQAHSKNREITVSIDIGTGEPWRFNYTFEVQHQGGGRSVSQSYDRASSEDPYLNAFLQGANEVIIEGSDGVTMKFRKVKDVVTMSIENENRVPLRELTYKR